MLLTESFEVPFIIQNIIENDIRFAKWANEKNEQRQLNIIRDFALSDYQDMRLKYNDEDIDSIIWMVNDYFQSLKSKSS